MSKKLEPVQRTIYDNYNIFDDYQSDAKDYLLGESDNEPSESDIWKLCYEYDYQNWETESDLMRKFFDKSDATWILTGTLGLWSGRYEGGFTFKNFDEMLSKISKDCEYYRFWDENGHFFIKCSHHDGTNVFEVKELTKRGEELLENWNNSYSPRYDYSEKDLHEKLFTKYSKLPNYMHETYGSDLREYKKTA